jgi:hypothetical protein
LVTGAFAQAEKFFRAAIAGGADQFDVRRELARSVAQQDRLEEALVLHEELRLEMPDDQQLLMSLAWLNDKLGRLDETSQLYVELTKKFPGAPAGWLGLGLSFRAEGRIDEAVEAFRQAIRINPTFGQAWWEIANIKSDIFTDADVEDLKAALAQTVRFDDQAFEHFALGRALHQRRSYGDAFEHFATANRLLDEDFNYDPEQLHAEIGEVSHRFTSGYFAQLAEGGDPSQAPIFVVSLPRAGSTLVEQMLGSHPDIEALGELTYIPSLIRLMMERATVRGRTTFVNAIAAMTPEERQQLGDEYLRRVQPHRSHGAAHFIDKMPHNWSNILFIRHILPNARVVEVRRAPVSSGFANFSHWFTRAHSSSFSLEHIGRTYRDYVRMMSHLDEVAPGLVHHISYEELVDQPEPVLRSTLNYLDLPWNESVLQFHKTDRNIRTPSAEQVRRPLNREGIGTWKPYREWLGPLFEALGPLADEELAEADRA